MALTRILVVGAAPGGLRLPLPSPGAKKHRKKTQTTINWRETTRGSNRERPGGRGSDPVGPSSYFGAGSRRIPTARRRSPRARRRRRSPSDEEEDTTTCARRSGRSWSGARTASAMQILNLKIANSQSIFNFRRSPLNRRAIY